jgi:hypothetical protein
MIWNRDSKNGVDDAARETDRRETGSAERERELREERVRTYGGQPDSDREVVRDGTDPSDRERVQAEAAERDREERQQDRVGARAASVDTARQEPTTRAPRAKTSAAAAFSLAFGTAALFAALTAILSPLALLFGILALVLGISGVRAASRPHVTGRGVAVAGLVLGGLGVLLAAVLLAGAVTVLNNEDQVNRIEQELDDLRENLPTQVPTPG